MLLKTCFWTWKVVRISYNYKQGGNWNHVLNPLIQLRLMWTLKSALMLMLMLMLSSLLGTVAIIKPLKNLFRTITIIKLLWNLFRTITAIKPHWNLVKNFFFRELSPELGESSAKSTCTYNKPSRHRKHATIVYYNARSLIPKMDELKAVSDVTKPDIICIVETWLNNEITDVEVNLPYYQLST